MRKIGRAKILGCIGAILTLTGILAIIGLIILLIAVKYIAEESKEKSISRNYLMYFIFSLVAIIFLFLVPIGESPSFEKFISKRFEEVEKEIIEIMTEFNIWVGIEGIVTGFFAIVASIFLIRSYNKIAEYTKVDLFKITGIIYLIGAILIYVGGGITLITAQFLAIVNKFSIFIEFIMIFLILIAKILEIVSFFSLPEEIPKSDLTQ